MDRKKTQFKAPACLGLPGRVRIYNLHEKKLEQPVVSSLVIQKNKKGIDFIVLTIVRGLLKVEMQGSLRMVKSVGV